MIEIRYGEQYEVIDLAGQTVSEGRAQFKSEFGIPDKASARLNGAKIKSSAEIETVLNDDDKLTFAVIRSKVPYLVSALLLAMAITGGVFAFGFINATAGKQISYIDLPLLFFQSRQGLIFVIIAILFLAIFLYSGELSRGGGWLHRRIFSPVISEEKRANRMLTRKIEATEHKVDATEQALVQFSGAISEYAKHLASHTSAIEGLAEASNELRKGAAEQNRVLGAIMDNVVNTARKQEPIVTKAETPPPAPKPAVKEVKTFREIHELAGQSFAAQKPKTTKVKTIHVVPTFTRHHPVTSKPATAELKPANPVLEPTGQSPAAPKTISKEPFHVVPALSRQPLPAGCARVQPPKPTTEEILERLRKIRNQL